MGWVPQVIPTHTARKRGTRRFPTSGTFFPRNHLSPVSVQISYFSPSLLVSKSPCPPCPIPNAQCPMPNSQFPIPRVHLNLARPSANLSRVTGCLAVHL
ncbi:MAG: hypothetical protein F6J93_04355 [Oscillatoria sp. SIO1A7]|nr:hypothetical protein [Oscillatoria sp. SIO1A7]